MGRMKQVVCPFRVFSPLLTSSQQAIDIFFFPKTYILQAPVIMVIILEQTLDIHSKSTSDYGNDNVVRGF